MAELLLSKGLRRNRAALLQNGRLQRYDFERRGNESLLGGIFLGRITKIIRSGGFIDLGLGPMAYLNLRDDHGRHEGEALAVRVIRDGYHDKGPTLSSELNIAGRYLVGLLDGGGVKYSKQIAGPDRDKLGFLAKPLTDAHHGVIFRRAAAGAEDRRIQAEAEQLASTLAALQQSITAAKAPLALHPAPCFFTRILQEWRLQGNVDVHIDHRDLIALCGDHDLMATVHDGDTTLFAARGMEEAVAALLQPAAALPSGGQIIIEETQALTTIDVNSAAHGGTGDAGHRALSVNLEAAREIGWQVRLRQLGGHFVVDFLRLEASTDAARVLQELRRAITAEGGQGRVAGPSKFGLYEFTLARQGASLAQRLRGPCPACGSRSHGANADLMADEILEHLAREARARKTGRLTLHAAGPVINAIGKDLALLHIAVDTQVLENSELETYEISDGGV